MKIKKTIFTTTFILTLSMCSLQPAITVSASSQSYSVGQEGNTVSPQADVTRWLYKIENGKKYKRLYNSSTDTWLTDWIYLGDV